MAPPLRRLLPLCGALAAATVATALVTTPTRFSRPRVRVTRSAAADPSAEDDHAFDLVVLGAGPVGARAALQASELGKRVCLVDAPKFSGALFDESRKEDLSLGGPTGLFSKALRDAGKKIAVHTLRGMGIHEDSIWTEIGIVCTSLAAVNARDYRGRLKATGVELVNGYARFADPADPQVAALASDECTVVDVALGGEAGGTRQLRASHVLIATGSRPFRPAHIPFLEHPERIFDSDSINGLKFLPRSIAITGSGIIAIEYAKILTNLGAEVTLLIRDKVPKRALEKLGLDPDLAATLVTDLVRSGVRIERNCEAAAFDVPRHSRLDSRQPVKITLTGKGGAPRTSNQPTQLAVDAYLAAVGRESNTGGLGLDTLGVDCDEYGNILVRDTMETSRPGVYAAGDVVGRPYLASTGCAQGNLAVSCMFGDKKSGQGMAASAPSQLVNDPFAFPIGLWTNPEAAYFGLTSAQAKKRGIDAAEGMALYRECLRGCVFSPEGLLKLVFDQESGVIVGVHVVGDDACEIIHYGMELVRARRTVADVTSGMYSAVTFHELYQIAARAALDPTAARLRRREAGAAWAAMTKAKARARRQRMVPPAL